MSTNPTRERILSAARELLNQEDGLAGVTIGKVAADANVSRATLYRYFSSKETLLRAAGVSKEQLDNVETTRERIIEATIEIVGERGIHNTTFDEIANRVGITTSGLHWHYKNKEELFSDIGQYIPFVTSMAKAVEEAGSEQPDLESLLSELITTLLAEGQRRRGAIRYILFEAGIYPDVTRAATQHTIGRAFPLLVRMFEHYERAGQLRPGTAQAAAQAFLGTLLLLILVRPTFQAVFPQDDEETARELVDIILNGVSAKDGAN